MTSDRTWHSDPLLDDGSQEADPISDHFARDVEFDPGGPALAVPPPPVAASAPSRAPGFKADTRADARAKAPSPPRDRAQRAAFDVLRLALAEGHVYAALTGPAGVGKTAVLASALADPPDRKLRTIRIARPDRVDAALAARIEAVARSEATKQGNADTHVVLAVDDAHTASDELLRCLTRLAVGRRGQRLPQVFLSGRPELWDRLAAEEYAPLSDRLAIRPVLQAAAPEDAWAPVERDLMRARGRARAGAAPGADPATAAQAGEAPPEPALRPAVPFAEDEPDFAEPAAGRRRGRVLLPLGLLLVLTGLGSYALSGRDRPPGASDSESVAAPAPAAPRDDPAAPSGPATADARLPAPVSAGQAVPDGAAREGGAGSASAREEAFPALDGDLSRTWDDIGPPEPPAKSAPTDGPTAQAGVTAPFAQPDAMALLLRRGDERLATGDLSAARLFYEKAALSGSARGARSAARTYDRAHLDPANAAYTADKASALAWYRLAAALGDAEAAIRLRQLEAER